MCVFVFVCLCTTAPGLTIDAPVAVPLRPLLCQHALTPYPRALTPRDLFPRCIPLNRYHSPPAYHAHTPTHTRTLAHISLQHTHTHTLPTHPSIQPHTHTGRPVLRTLCGCTRRLRRGRRLTSSRTRWFASHTKWPAASEPAPQGREGQGCLREFVEVFDPSMHSRHMPHKGVRGSDWEG